MTRQRRLTAARRTASWLWAACALLVFSAAARAQQVFIDDAFVHRVNGNCIVETDLSGVPRFRCPPIPQASCGNVRAGHCPEVCLAAGWTDANPNGCGFQAAVNLSTPVASVTPCTDGTGAAGDIGSPTVCQGGTAANAAITPGTANGEGYGWGNISNDPHLEFDTTDYASLCDSSYSGSSSYPLPPGDTSNNICNSQMFLCASIGYSNTQDGSSSTDVGVDELSFEVFQFLNGTNPLDPTSAPPLRTFFIDAPGVLCAGCDSSSTQCMSGVVSSCPSYPNAGGPLGPFCVLWDGNTNIQGAFGKRNGQYGFRAIVETNATGVSGNIQITAVRAYPSGATRDDNVASCPGTDGCLVSQNPITVDVVNVHAIISSPTLVGAITPVPAEPYNIFYRLSKDSTMYMTINNPDGSVIRTILPGVPRVGEGVPNGTLTNGDSWNGREDNGDFAPPGIYLASLQAFAQDQYGPDLSSPTTFQIGIDPLQITDIKVQPLLDGSTSLAVINYTLTEPATVYIDVYPPGTQICNLSNNLNSESGASGIPDQSADPNFPPKQFETSTAGTCTGWATSGAYGLPTPPTGIPLQYPLKRIVVQANSRTAQTAFWDGRDQSGNLLYDGNYVFVIYADLPSQNGIHFAGTGPGTIWTSQAKSGLWPVIRGFVGISQVSVGSTVVGSSPAVSGVNPFTFNYSLSRDGLVSVKIFDAAGTRLVKTLVNNQMRPGNFANSEEWLEPIDDNGLYVSSGAYMVQLTAADPDFPANVSTTTALFMIDPYRITNVTSAPLLSGASDLLTISYELSNSMNVGVNIYPPGTYFPNINASWPPCGSVTPGACGDSLSPTGQPTAPIYQIYGLRVGKLNITEQWDGRDPNGNMVPDGLYVFTIIAQSTSTEYSSSPNFADDKVVGTLSVQRGQVIFTKYEVDPTIAQMFNSSDTITLDPYSINYSLTRQSSVTISILTTSLPEQVVRHLVEGEVRQNGILLTDVWDGRDDYGNFLPPGFYNVQTTAEDIASESSSLSLSTASVTISYLPLRIYDLAISPITLNSPSSEILYQVSEPMKVSIKVYKPGTVFDLAGNPSPPESLSLVKRIVEMKAARQEATSVWDGTNLQYQQVPDGTYRFRIVGSTDVTAIDSLTGNVLNPGALALDQLIDDIPVTRNGTLAPQGDFESNTFVYPNPATGPTVTFSIYIPFQGTIKVNIYNIAGQLVYEKDLGEFPPSYSGGPVTMVWQKANEAGRDIARGIYYAVIRADETLGGKQELQTVKKILNP